MHWRLSLTCCSIVANALSAGGIFIFPILSPALAYHLKLTQPQLTTIVLAGMAGQYPFSAVAGKVIDRYGPAACSFIASISFFLSFGLFSWEISKTPDDITQPSLSSFRRLTVLFGLAGLGTVFSYFSFLFCASKNFPKHIGIASGVTMALFGLSPLFLSLIASNFFSDPDTGLKVVRFLAFMAILSGSVHAFGALSLRVLPTTAFDTISGPTLAPDSERPIEPDEQTQLLPGKPPGVVLGDTAQDDRVNTTQEAVITIDTSGSSLDLLRDPYFWLLCATMVLTVGACEMVMSNIGTIVLALPPSGNDRVPREPSTDIATSTQVRLLSIANTSSRILVGPLADFISPIASHLPSGIVKLHHNHLINRMAFISTPAILLSITFLWMSIGVKTQQAVWPLSIGTGFGYGAIFTVLPSVVSSAWGFPNLGRNFGIITYSPFIGTPIFSYLYAYVSAYHTGPSDGVGAGGVCKGVSCWQLTFGLSSGASLLAFCSSLILWRAWRGKL